MSVLVELNVEYNRFFSKAVIALAREDYVAGRMYLEKAAKDRVIQDKDTNEALTKEDYDIAIECVKSSVLDVDRKEMELWIKNNRS